MSRILTVGALGVVLALAGCSSEPAKREAGNWKTEVKMEKFEVEGMPPELKSAMQQQMSSSRVFEECLTKEQAEKEDMAAEISKSSGNGACKWSKNNVSGGKIDVAGTCSGMNGEQQEMAMTGTVGAKASDIRVTMKGKSPMGGGNMEVVMHAVGTYTGPCKT